MAIGRLTVTVFVDNIAQPLPGASVVISGENTDIHLTTDTSGKTEAVDLPAPNIEYSLEPQNTVQPFSTYDIYVSKEGLGFGSVIGAQVYAGVDSFQNVYLQVGGGSKTTTAVPSPTLWQDDNFKIEENHKSKPMDSKVLPKVIVPGYIIVHDGVPTDTEAPNYYVTFPDYIKNVASSEIYPSWPKETLKANILAIVSFTLNRVFTEWYLSKGYHFTITSSTAYDQKYAHNRTIFDTISNIVDETFNEYLTFPQTGYPFLAQYSDGVNVVKEGWLSQWGSKFLGDQGYNALQIVRYYYGKTTEIKQAELVSDLPTSFPGYNLKEGACGEEVQMIQNALNKIRGSYPALPLIQETNGIYNADTIKSVIAFQNIFNLPVTGVVDFATWYRISAIFVAVSNMLKGIFNE